MGPCIELGIRGLIAFDLDPEAIKVAKNLEAEDKRFSIVHRPFGDMAEVVDAGREARFEYRCCLSGSEV